MAEDIDNIDDFEAQDTAKRLPVGWLILFWGLILFGIFYTAMYSPSMGGWSQEREFSENRKTKPPRESGSVWVTFFLQHAP